MRAKLGDIVSVIFLDHCRRPGGGESGPIELEVLGYLIEIEKSYITVAPWIETSMEVDENTEMYIIIRSAIKKVRRLR
jgi:hypothetical protein